MEQESAGLTLANANLGRQDRIIRFIIGALLAAGVMALHALASEPTYPELGIYYSTLVSFYPLLTSLIGFDPVYRMFHINTRERRIALRAAKPMSKPMHGMGLKPAPVKSGKGYKLRA